jgi:hypothetical protein
MLFIFRKGESNGTIFGGDVLLVGIAVLMKKRND